MAGLQGQSGTTFIPKYTVSRIRLLELSGQSLPVTPLVHGPMALCSHPQGLIQGVDDLLENPVDLETLPHSEQNYVATILLHKMEHVLFKKLSKTPPNGSLTFNAPGGTGKYLGLPPGSALSILHLIPLPTSLELSDHSQTN